MVIAQGYHVHCALVKPNDTADDSLPGPDGLPMTEDDLHLLPIAGVKVFLIGLENHAVFTDAAGEEAAHGTSGGW